VSIENVTIRYGELRNLFLTRFHEDWQQDAASRAEVVDDVSRPAYEATPMTWSGWDEGTPCG